MTARYIQSAKPPAQVLYRLRSSGVSGFATACFARLELARQGRERVLGNFNAERMAATTFEVYQCYPSESVWGAHPACSAVTAEG